MLQDPRSGGGRHAFGADVVFDSDHNSGEWTDLLASGDSLVDLLSVFEYVLRHVEEAFELRVGETDAGEVRLRDLGGCGLAGEEGTASGEDLGLRRRGGRSVEGRRRSCRNNCFGAVESSEREESERARRLQCG